jgi:hypothetical protein
MFKKLEDENSINNYLYQEGLIPTYNGNCFLNCNNQLIVQNKIGDVKIIDENVDRCLGYRVSYSWTTSPIFIKNDKMFILEAESYSRCEKKELCSNTKCKDFVCDHFIFLGMTEKGKIIPIFRAANVAFEEFRDGWIGFAKTHKTPSIISSNIFAYRKEGLYIFRKNKAGVLKFKRVSPISGIIEAVAGDCYWFDPICYAAREDELICFYGHKIQSRIKGKWSYLTGFNHCSLAIKDKKIYCLLNCGRVFCVENKHKWSKIYENGICETESGDKYCFSENLMSGYSEFLVKTRF